MKKALAWLKLHWKVVGGGLLLLFAGGAGAAAARKRKLSPPSPVDPGQQGLRTEIQDVNDRIDAAREVYNVEVAVAATKSEGLKAELKEAMAVDDGEERRARVKAIGRKVGL